MLVVVAVIAAAAIAFALADRQHDGTRRNAVVGSPILGLAAKRSIQKGTPGDLIRTHPGYTKLVALTTRDGQVRRDAVFNSSTLAGKVAVEDIPTGRLLTTSDFAYAAVGGPDPGGSWQRAVVVKPAPSTQIGRQITAGSHVDVWAATTGHGSDALRRLDRDMEVLAASTSAGTVTLKATPRQAGELISAGANGRIVVRPRR